MILFLNVGIKLFLGVAFAANAPSWATKLGLEFDSPKLVVKNADKTKYAGVIGVQAQDTITAVNGRTIKSTEQFENTIKNLAEKSFEAWQFTVQRLVNGNSAKIKLQPQPRFHCNPLKPIGCGKLHP